MFSKTPKFSKSISWNTLGLSGGRLESFVLIKNISILEARSVYEKNTSREVWLSDCSYFCVFLEGGSTLIFYDGINWTTLSMFVAAAVIDREHRRTNSTSPTKDQLEVLSSRLSPAPSKLGLASQRLGTTTS